MVHAMARAMAVVIVAVGSGYWVVAFASWLSGSVPGIAVHRHETVYFIVVFHVNGHYLFPSQ